MSLACLRCEGYGQRVNGYASSYSRDGQDDCAWRECAACSGTGIAICELCMRSQAAEIDQGVAVCLKCDPAEMVKP